MTTDTVTITVLAADARLMAAPLYEMRRNWADAADAAETQKDEAFERMHQYAAERVAEALHNAGWEAAQYTSPRS